jgi:CHAT domain-containing protein
VVELYTLPARIVAFVLRAGADAPAVYEAPISADELLYRYLRPYEDEVLERARAERAGRRTTGVWLELGERLLAPLAEALERAELVYLIPHGRLHLLPLHALSCGGRPFVADRSVAYAPSAGALIRVLDRPGGAGGTDLVLGYTPNPAERRLFHGEARAVARALGCAPLVGRRARAGAVRRGGPHAGRIHLSCHGSFDAQDPLASSVELADGPLTARDWMRLDLHADLVTLSACRTAVSHVGRGDELTGLTRALLSAGASSVLVTLWSVDAESAASWIDDFYGRITATPRQTKAAAARAATLTLMDDEPDPYLWAPFVLVGDAE